MLFQRCEEIRDTAITIHSVMSFDMNIHEFYTNLRPVCPPTLLDFFSECFSSLPVWWLNYDWSRSGDLNPRISRLALFEGVCCVIARRYFGPTFVPSPILIYIQTGNNDCCPQFVATHLVYFGRVPRVEKHEMDHRSLKQHPNVWGPLIVVTVVKTLSKHRRNVSRTDKPGCVNIEKSCRDRWAQSLHPSVWTPFWRTGACESSGCTFDESIKLWNSGWCISKSSNIQETQDASGCMI